jgi:hypothetical protein
MFRFRTGDRIKPSAEGLRTFPRWVGREGTIIGRSRDEDIWEIRWHGRAKTERVHKSFIVPASDQDLETEVWRARA